MLLVIPAAIFLVAGLGIGIENHIKNTEQEEHKLEAKNTVLSIEQKLVKFAKSDKDWNDGLGFDLSEYKKDQDGYLILTTYKDKYPDTDILLKSFSDNKKIKIIISASVKKESYSEIITLSRVGVEQQVPILFANNMTIKNPYFSSYDYDQVHKKVNCMTNPSLLLSYPVSSTIENIKFKVPNEPCSNVYKNIRMSFEGVAVLKDINFVNTVYAQKGADFTASNLDTLYLSSDNMELIDSIVKKINITPKYKFPRIEKLMPNILSSQSTLIASKYKKSCEYGERLHIGDGSLSSIVVKRGCDAIVLDGSQYDIGSLIVEDGANVQVDFSNNVEFNVKKINMDAFAGIPLNSINNGKIVIRSENIKIGQSDEIFLGEIAKERAGRSHIVCSVPGSCLLDTNYLSVASNSSLHSDTISRTIASIKNSEFSGSILAETLVAINSNFSNIIDDNGDKIINNDFLSVFVGTMQEDSIQSFMGNADIEKCTTIDDCKMTALRLNDKISNNND